MPSPLGWGQGQYYIVIPYQYVRTRRVKPHEPE